MEEFNDDNLSLDEKMIIFLLRQYEIDTKKAFTLLVEVFEVNLAPDPK